jgi:integrase
VSAIASYVKWWGRGDLNPGSPAPQAGILVHTRRICTKIPTKSDSLTRRRPLKAPTKQKELIINTLINLKHNGKAENTIKSVSQNLNRISKHTDLAKPEEVKQYIADAKRLDNGKPLSNGTKSKLIFCYDCLCKANKIQWQAPRYKWEQHVPIIPTTANVNKIISASTKRYATIFTILAETGLEGQELHKTHKNNIDTEQGIISAKGCKGHASGSYKLKTHTAEMLREYMAKNPQEYPFPKPKVMSQIWRRVRNRVADNLKQLQLKKIPMKNLRNYSGAKLYYSLKDPIAVMRHLRHKKLETTMHYLRGITIGGEEEYTCKTATNIKEATELIENGFEYITEIDGTKLFKKRK